MEFWAAEVKSGETLKVEPGEGMVLHLSQASIGEFKKDKGNESVCLFVNVDGQKLVLGTLFSDKLPQQQFDLVFDRDFELSHNWKSGNVYFYGYRANNPFDDFATEDGGGDFDSDSEEDIPLIVANNGKPETKVKEDKPAEAKKANAEKGAAAGKQKVKIAEPNLDLLKHGEDDDSSDDDDSGDEDEGDSMDEDEDESDSEGDDESDESDEETPKKLDLKVETSKKRAADSAVKTPGPDKKAKLTTPQKTDGKKGSGHVATPHPAKQAGKNKNQQTPKSGGGSHTCKSCNRAFGSENALESHTKAKHSAGK